MNIILELPIRKEKLDCANIGPILAPYGININKVVDELNNKLEKKQISINSKVPIEINVENRTWKLIETQKKTSEQIKSLAKNGKIKYSDLEDYVIKTYKIDISSKSEIDKKLKELTGTIKSMHLEIVR